MLDNPQDIHTTNKILIYLQQVMSLELCNYKEYKDGTTNLTEVGTKVIIGNHDRMAARKAMTGGIPSAWFKIL